MENSKMTTWGKIEKLERLIGVENQQDIVTGILQSILSDMKQTKDLTYRKVLYKLIAKQEAYLKRLKIDAFGPVKLGPDELGSIHKGRAYFQPDKKWY